LTFIDVALTVELIAPIFPCKLVSIYIIELQHFKAVFTMQTTTVITKIIWGEGYDDDFVKRNAKKKSLIITSTLDN
jgi:hypothetical protein